MILILKCDASEADAHRLMHRIRERGLKPLYLPGLERVLVGAVGDDRLLVDLDLDADPAVESAKAILSPFKLVSRELRGHDTVVSVGKVSIGGQRIAIVAACEGSEGASELAEIGNRLIDVGVRALRLGSHRNCASPYRPRRSSPRSHEGVAHSVGLATVHQVVDTGELDWAVEHADCLQVGAYGMHNSELLRALGSVSKPVIVDRSPCATPDELLLAAECVVSAGNEAVILCEKGSRAIGACDPAPDLAALRYLKQRSHLPVLVDLSTSATRGQALNPLAHAAIACGADGLVLEVLLANRHGSPVCGGPLTVSHLSRMMPDLQQSARLAGRVL